MPGSCTFNGVSDKGVFHTGAAIFTAYPLTFCAWFKTSIVQAKDFFQTGDVTSNIRFQGIRQNNANADWWDATNLVGGGAVDTTGATWMSLVASNNGSTITTWLNGVQVGTLGGAFVVPAGLLDISVGVTSTLTAALFAGKIAHASIHTAFFTLSDAQHHALGWSANRLPSPFAWYKLETNGNDSIGTRNLTMTGGTFTSDGPTIDYGSISPWSCYLKPARNAGVRPYDSRRIRRHR